MPEIDKEPFHRAVVALNGGPSDARIVRLVGSLAAKSKADLIAVHVVEIDWTLPLDADIAGRSEDVQRVLDSAEAIAEGFKLKMEPSCSKRGTSPLRSSMRRPSVGPTCWSWACHIGKDSVGSSRSAGPSPTSCRTRHAPSGSCASR